MRSGIEGCWVGLRQVHGSTAVVWNEECRGVEAVEVAVGDALVTNRMGVAACVLTADCAPVALASPEGIVAAAHCGWRGLVAGILPSALKTMRSLGASQVLGALGPCIHPCCARFGEPELDQVVAVAGPKARSTTREGEPSLDLPAAVEEVLGRLGVYLERAVDRCTACSWDFFSWRRDACRERMALVVARSLPEADSKLLT
jgi:YfiH family protein